jgi:tetratricopeptide (TPR) repeat protein
MRFAIALGLLVGVLASPALSAAEVSADCFDYSNAFGPFDYRTASQKNKSLVEGAHFTREVEMLRHGHRGSLAGDISYTLNSFPNHPRALVSMMKLGEREKTERPRGARYTVACYFARAVRFAPDDGAVRVLYGIYLLKLGKKKEAVEQLQAAQELVGDDRNVHYNLGLAYFDMKDFDRALLHAKKAYELGFPLPGLRDKLKQAGKWRD